MFRKRIASMLILMAMVASLAACGGTPAADNANSGGNAAQATTAPATQKPAEPAAATDKPADAASGEMYTFTHYFNYDWWTIHPWGVDETSKYWKEKYNINVEFSKPDSDPQAKLNLMISSGDIPDSIMMDRDANNKKMAQMGLFIDLAELKKNNPNFDNGVGPVTQEFLKIDGKLYGIPNWPRKLATGGNNGWIYNQKLYDAAGKPALKTFEDLYAYAKKVKDTIPTTSKGQPTVPFGFDNANGDAQNLIIAMNRSAGNVNLAGWYSRVDGKLQLAMRSPVYRASIMEANKWVREGIIDQSAFTDTREQYLEKMTGGRVALMYYDFSQEDSNHFRSILKQADPEDSYEVLTDPVYPPKAGVTKVYADEKPTIGWNVTCISKAAKDPQKIFDLWTSLYTKEGAIEMMYGPKGILWDELDKDGNPVMKIAESEVAPEEKDRIGMWFWTIPGHSDWVDTTKFAVNAAQPAEKRSWVISLQSDVFTPIMFNTDEHNSLSNSVDPQSDLGTQRQLCEDTIKAEMTKIILSTTAEEAEKAYDALIKFCDENGMPEVEKAYDAMYQENLKLQGKSAYE